MAMNKYFSIPFNAGVRQDVPKSLLPLPFLTRAENFITRDEGRLENRPYFKKISELPPEAGTPLKLFTYNNTLYCFTDRYFLIYEKSLNTWKDIASNRTPPSALGRARNISSVVTPLVQKERDIENLAFAKFGQNLCFFYTYDSSPYAEGAIFYIQYSIPDDRIAQPEKQLVLFPNDKPVGLFAYTNDESPTEFWVGAAYETKFRAVRFNPSTGQIRETYNNSTAGIQRFRLFKDRVFYTTDGTSVQSFIFNPDASDKAQATDVPLSRLRDFTAHSRGFNNRVLYDFKDWTDFQYSNEDFKVVWSLNTGYFMLNENNRIIANLYANLLPERAGVTPRVKYAGDPVIVDNTVYVPVLRSGQRETVNREAVVDRILPQGRNDLLQFRPLGLELISFDMESKEPPDSAQIGKQLLISGPVLKWTGGVSVSEFSFSEKPMLEKTSTPDYDRWPYLNIDQNLPSTQELNRTQYNDFYINMDRRDGPYLVDVVTFRSSTSGGNIGIGSGYGSWDSGATTGRRTLRYASAENSRNISDEYKGILTYVYYDSAEQALAVVYNSVPTSLASGKDHPQSIMINGVNYVYDSIVLSGSTLTCYHYTPSSPLLSGEDYNVIQPYANVLRVPENTAQSVQVSDEDNQFTAITLNDIRLRKFEIVTGSDQAIIAEGPILNSASVGFVELTTGSNPHVGAFKAGIAQTVGADISALTDFERDTSIAPFTLDPFGGGVFDAVSNSNTIWLFAEVLRGSDNGIRGYAYTIDPNNPGRLVQDTVKTFTDYDIPSADEDGVVFDGTTMWFVRSNAFNDHMAFAYTIRSNGQPSRDDTKDITFPRQPNEWTGGCSDGTTLWFLNNENSRAYAYNASTRRADPGKNITLPVNGNWRGGFSDGETLWFFRFERPIRKAYAFKASDQSRDEDKDFDLPAGVVGVAVEGSILWTTNDTKQINVFRRSGGANEAIGTLNNANITSKVELAGIWSDRSKLYIVFGALSSEFATGQLLATEVEDKIDHWRYTLDDIVFTTLRNTITSATKTYYTEGDSVYVRYEMGDFPTSALLRNLILDEDLINDQTLSLNFRSPTANKNVFVEGRDEIETQVLSTIYSTFDENNTPKEVSVDAINNNITLYNFNNQDEFSDFLFDDSSFNKIKGPVSGNHYYSFHTTGTPLVVNSEVLNFDEDSKRLRVVYPLVRTVPELTPERLLSAHVYNYKTRFKWIDENGVEHRSQYSDDFQLASTQHIGIENNRPTFTVSYLNLTNKTQGSVVIEIYRTKNKSQTFQYVKEVQSNENLQEAIITDDVTDDRLGAVAGNDNISISGAQHCLSYQGRFVLYGFPDKPNRILISSPENPFTNLAIAFQQNTPATPNDVLEILLEENIKAINVMDSFLIIFGERQTYSWSLRPGSLVQENPAVITGLSAYTVDSLQSSVETTEGLMFNSDRGRGIQLLSRGLTWTFAGEAVKKATLDGRVLATVRKDENIYFFKERNIKDPDQPQVLVFNQRYKTWTSYGNRNLTSAVIWDNKLTALSLDNSLWQEEETENPVSQEYEIETGWLNLTRALIGFQRLRDVYLLGEFTGLQALSLEFDYDFIPGHNREKINFDLSGYGDSPAIAGGVVLGQPTLRDKREFRFQPRNQGGTAIRIKIAITANSVKIDALRIGGSWDRIAGTQTQRSSQRS